MQAEHRIALSMPCFPHYHGLFPLLAIRFPPRTQRQFGSPLIRAVRLQARHFLFSIFYSLLDYFAFRATLPFLENPE